MLIIFGGVLLLGLLVGLTIGAIFIVRQMVSPKAAADVQHTKAVHAARREVAKEDAKADIIRQRQVRLGMISPQAPPAPPVPPAHPHGQ